MIDTPTAWSILCTPLGIAAGLGWIRCARMLAKARAWSVQLECMKDDYRAKLAASQAGMLRLHAEWKTHHDSISRIAEADRARAIDAEDRLRKIEQSRHASAKHARAAQLAQQSAAKEARRLELERNVADRARVKIRRVA